MDKGGEIKMQAQFSEFVNILLMGIYLFKAEVACELSTEVFLCYHKVISMLFHLHCFFFSFFLL